MSDTNNTPKKKENQYHHLTEKDRATIQALIFIKVVVMVTFSLSVTTLILFAIRNLYILYLLKS